MQLAFNVVGVAETVSEGERSCTRLCWWQRVFISTAFLYLFICSYFYRLFFILQLPYTSVMFPKTHKQNVRNFRSQQISQHFKLDLPETVDRRHVTIKNDLFTCYYDFACLFHCQNIILSFWIFASDGLSVGIIIDLYIHLTNQYRRPWVLMNYRSRCSVCGIVGSRNQNHKTLHDTYECCEKYAKDADAVFFSQHMYLLRNGNIISRQQELSSRYADIVADADTSKTWPTAGCQ